MNPLTRIRRRYSCALAAVAAALVLVFGASSGRAGAGTAIASCGQTVTTDAFLTQDLVCTGDGVVVGATDITIDLKGFTIRGDGGAGDFGVDDFDLGSFDGVTIQNGVVRNFQIGVYAVASNVRIARVVASGNTGYGLFLKGAAATVSTSTTAGNGAVGIYVAGDGARIKASGGSGNGVAGIFVLGAKGQVTSSTASGNGAHGIEVFGDAAKISGNRTTGNGFAGGVSDLDGLGIWAGTYTTPPVGKNVALGNDNPTECDPASLC